MKYKFPIFFFFTVFFLHSTAGDDVQGCGGYIKSDVEIDFSQVGIKLYTTQGSLKYETDCAPNDGYYFMPVEDKGEYVIKVVPPSGWSVEPDEVKINFDGHSDLCSRKEDVNFYFKGFAVLGQVQSAGSTMSREGPEGVIVSLHKGNSLLQTTETDSQGKFVFTPLGSGQYLVTVDHPSLAFTKDSVSVTVKDSNGQVPVGSLVVKGYSISGILEGETSASPKPSDAIVLLHCSSKEARQHFAKHHPGCTNGAPKGYKGSTEDVLCYTRTDKTGAYKFSDMIPGTYSISIVYSTDKTSFLVSPDSISVDVKHENAKVGQNFKVQGYKASGRVMTSSKNGKPLAGAVVKIPKLSLELTTDSQGKYNLDRVNTGKYEVQVTAKEYQFSPSSHSLSPSSPLLKDISPSHYLSCFKVLLDTVKEQTWTISVVSSGGSTTSVSTDPKTEEGCVMLPPDSYKAKVELTDVQQAQGIRFGPSEHSLKVSDAPVKNIIFSQFLGEVEVSVKCIQACPSVIPLALRLSSDTKVIAQVDAKVKKEGAKTASAVFQNVVPGRYQVSVSGGEVRETWCWQEDSVDAEINTENVKVALRQSGYLLTVSSSHATKVDYSLKGEKGSIDVIRGATKKCLSLPGDYVFTPQGCHQFSSPSYQWSTSDPKLLSLVATKHTLTGTIKSSEPGDFSILATRQDSTSFTLSTTKADGGQNTYLFSLLAAEGEVLTLTASTPDNLFQYEPAEGITFTAPGDCMQRVAHFSADKALFIEGKVTPPVEGVQIKVISKRDSSLVATFTTDSRGLYSAGPLDNSHSYDVEASLTGYTITPLDTIGHFEAFKLAEVVVSIKDHKVGAPLEGVVVSMSGGKSYRQNKLSDSEGNIIFHSLMPGEYFVRCSMKEYNFDPPTKMIKIEQGQSVKISVKGNRVAYSAIGTVTSLTGVGEGGVSLEAVGEGVGCEEYREEAVSQSSSGAFRIRGLQPSCQYKIVLKDVPANKHLDQMMPVHHSVRVTEADVTDIQLVVLRHFNQLDVVGNIEAPKEHLKTLSVKVYREDVADSPIHTIKITDHSFFMLPPMVIDHKTYSLRLESSLSKHEYSYHNPEVSFTADTGFKSVKLTFKPTLKDVDTDMNHSTMAGMFLAIAIISMMYNYEKMGPAIDIAIQGISNFINKKAFAGGDYGRRTKKMR